MKATSLLASALLLSGLAPAYSKTPDGKPLIVLIAGKPSHGPGEHEHNAGVQLLAKCLAQGAAHVATKVHLNAEWPSAEEFAQADTVVIYSDGGGGHPMLQADNLDRLKAAIDRGTGLVCLHYAVEPAFEPVGWEAQRDPNGKAITPTPLPAERGSKGKGAAELQEWLGGYFEQFWSVNPHWTANFKELPKHPISQGVTPFSTNDEWYYHMRFKRGMQGVTPILSDVPPPETMNRGEGPHAGNPDVKREVLEEKKPQHVAWAVERPNGGRGFGFTGGHFHKGWANDDQRKLVLNALLWTAKAEIPASGVESKLTEEDLAANLDPKPPRKPKPAASTTPAASPAGKAVFTSLVVHDQPVAIKADLKGAKELYLAVTDGGDGFGADWADWIEPVLVKADGSKIKLTELTPKSTKVGWGKFGVNVNAGGQPLKVGGQPVAFGFGAHAPSIVGFDLPEGIVAFEARGGVDDGGLKQGNGATVGFQVYNANPGNAPLASIQDTGSAADRFGLEAARRNMGTFTVAPGLQATLVAAEPMVQNPTAIDIDPRGRIWAAECVNYRKYMDLRPEGDRVVILEDTNGDGEADKAKTFYQNKELTNPLGILVLPQAKGTKVIVSAAPNVWLLSDNDGDDVAEDAKVIFKIGGVWNYDHQIHSFVFGTDGKFYFNAGNSITDLNWPDGTRVKDLAGNEITNKGTPYRQGMVYRCDIDLATGKASNVETLGHNFRNNYEVAVDSFGTMWQSDNDDDGNKGVRINYVMEFGNFGYTDELTGAGWRSPRTNMETEIPLQHWHQNDPGVVPNLLQTGGGSPTGILVNEGSALGGQFTNQLIHCDAGPRVVRAYPVEKSGAGYTAKMVDILTSTDNWYRPSDVAIAPDGSLYISDWYDPGVGGHAMGDHEPGKVMGRIYRVTATGAAAKAPAADFSNAESAAKALQSPNNATVYAAWEALSALGAKAEPALEKLWKSNDPRQRARALGLLARIPGHQTQHLRNGLLDPDSDVRVAAVRLCATLARSNLFDTAALEEDHALMGKLIRDHSPQVRRQIALSLYRTKEIARLWAMLATQHDGQDRWYLEALGIGAIGNEEACFDAWLTMVGDKWNTAGGRDIIWRMRTAKAADYLAKIIADDKVTASEKSRFLREFDFLPASPDRTKALTQIATAGKAEGVVREALARLKSKDFETDPALASVLKQTLDRAKGKPELVDLVSDLQVTGQGAALLEAALKNPQDARAARALKMVLNDSQFGTLFDSALAGPQADTFVALLGTSSEARVITALAKIVTDDANPLPRRIAAVQALARTQAGATKLVQLARNGELSVDLKPAATTALNLVQYPTLKTDIAALFPAPAALGGQSLPPIPELAKLKGDLAKGRAVFERAESSCITCHRINDKGADFGPALSELGSKLPKEAIYDAIINPNTGLSMGFETTQLTMKDGAIGMGIVRSETQEEVVLGLPGGVTAQFRKGEIGKREKLTTSMMPSGLNQALTQDDLVNLVEYLVSLKKK